MTLSLPMTNDSLGGTVIANGDMSGHITSTVVSIPYYSVIAIQVVSESATHAGTIELQESLDKVLWSTVESGTRSIVNGVAFSWLQSFNYIGGKWLRLKYTRTSGIGTLNAVILPKGDWDTTMRETLAKTSRREGMPELDRLDVATGAAISAAGGDIKLVGRELLQGMTFDSLVRTQTTASVTIYALKPGDSGITVQLIKGAGAAGLTYNTLTKACVIDIGAAGSTDDAVATLVNADASQCNGYLRATSAGGGSFTAVQAAAPLTGGVGDWANTKVMVGGLEALPANETGATTTAKWSDTDISCTTQAVGAATDIVTVTVQSNGYATQPFSATLTA